jgi:16S rRNA (cytidine1402-2'-O)-methyltransferase
VAGSGTLYVVATPIGNLGDVTRRAAETLAGADRIAAEDTRRTRALLTHLGVSGKPLVTLDANAPDRAVEDLVNRLAEGESVALVTDAGTPGVSDPGARLVRAAAARGVPVVAIPGASAVTAAVAVSGLVEGPFLFLAFLPRKGEKRRRAIRRIATSPEPVVLFEAPTRIRETLVDLAEAMPERTACIARELTKVHEEALRGSLLELSRQEITDRGEFTVVVAGAGEIEEDDLEDLDTLVAARLAAGDPPRTVADEVAAISGKPRREIYARVLELRRRLGEA